MDLNNNVVVCQVEFVALLISGESPEHVNRKLWLNDLEFSVMKEEINVQSTAISA